ncbi:hypothetical protein [Sphingomonas aracearum]|uniref:hypothetical protein n=1 Tax=Sphingomonas aracearum TaxID=2283317 RepID=UPI0011C055F3|nr:hypothetical protein [Sphingomonas aracearum]
MENGFVVNPAELMGAVALALQAIVLQNEIAGGPDRSVIANALRGEKSTNENSIEKMMAFFADVIEQRGSKTPDLRLV